jgi:hypothetical protein
MLMLTKKVYFMRKTGKTQAASLKEVVILLNLSYINPLYPNNF